MSAGGAVASTANGTSWSEMCLQHPVAHQVQRRAGVSGGRCWYRSVAGPASNCVIRGSRVDARHSVRRVVVGDRGCSYPERRGIRSVHAAEEG